MVEGGPPPVVSVRFPLHFEYVDDFGVIQFYQEDQTGSRLGDVKITLDYYKKVIIEEMEKLNLPVHKEEEGVVSTLLGMEVGGVPPVVRPDLQKQWMSHEVQWEIGRSGKSHASVVESIVALTTWLFMVMRCGLSVYQEVYPWIGRFRERKGILEVPMAVRKELLAAAVAVLLVGQDLTMGWNRTVYLFDASEEGGGICSTDASWEEITKESRWGVRGGWTKYTGEQDYFEHYRAEELAPEQIMIVREITQTEVPTYYFLHMFSGLKRDRDLEWYLVRIGARHGMKVVVISLDLAYGCQNDLYDVEVVKRLVQKGRELFWSGVHNGSPCSTWSRMRSQPGGPPPLRSRTYPWGLPKNSKS